MPGWSTVARLPFRPVRTAGELHDSIVEGRNFSPLAVFFFLSSCLYCLYAAHLVWMRTQTGTFLAGLGILAVAVLISTFVYVLVADMVGDMGKGRRLVFPLLLSTLAISGVFSLLGAVVYEAGILGLSKVKRALAVAVGIVAVWQLVVEAVNLRRVYGLRWWAAAGVELLARGISTSMALAFIGFMTGATRPWKHWRSILWVFGLS